jgi:Flp pilus assembly protein TadG
MRRRIGQYLSARSRGQSLVEAALATPPLLLLAFGVLAAGRVAQAQMGVSAVAREAARAGALAGSPAESTAQATARGREVANGYRLTNGSLEIDIDPGTFARGDRLRAEARYRVALDDLPLLGWTRVEVTGRQAERIDLYRSRWPTEGGR